MNDIGKHPIDDQNSLDDIDEPKEVSQKYQVKLIFIIKKKMEEYFCVIIQEFNESTLTEILDKQLAYVHVNLQIDPPPEPRRPPKQPVNWVAHFLRQPRKDRVVWPSKLYNFDKKFSQKTLHEQAEQLMELVKINEFPFLLLLKIGFFLGS